MIRLWPVVLCALFGACYQPSLGTCLVTCEAATGCPVGYSCGGNGYCHPDGEAEGDCPLPPGPDARVPDAAPDAPDADTTSPDAMAPPAMLRGLAAGESFTCGIDPADRLLCWGENRSGQLGRGGVSVRQPTPGLVNGPQAWTSVTTTARSACAITEATGEAYCWGDNDRGQLGRGGAPGPSGIPQPVGLIPSPGPWTTLSGWSEHVCGINAGRLFCWGRNSNGQLGDNDTTPSDRGQPNQVGTDTDWVAVATGLSHTCGIRDNGTTRALYCWGDAMGLGVSAGGNVFAPGTSTPHPLGETWFAVATGFQNTCAIDQDRDLYCWGHNGQGVVMTEVIHPVPAPALIDANSVWDQVSISFGHACARAGTAVTCWANSDSGQAGVHPSTPGMHVIAGVWTEVTTATEGNHSCGVRTDGAACWGYNNAGQLGLGVAGDALVPQQVEVATEPGKLWSQVVAGQEVTCAIAESDGAIWCWGFDTGALLDLGDQAKPRRLDALGAGWAEIDADFFHACAIKSNGELWCWGGNNGDGQLGHSTAGPGPVTGGGSWRDVGVGISSTCAIKDDRTLWCWGSDADGLVGDPASAVNRTAPRQVTGVVNGWDDVAVGQTHACAVRDTGIAACWGRNNDYAVDDVNPETVIEAPTDLAGTGWTAIDASTKTPSHSIGIAASVRLAWGNAFYGRLGLGASADTIMVPTSLGGEVADWTAIANGGEHGCGLRNGGQLWCWGYQFNLPLGGGNHEGSYIPVQVGSASGWLEVSSGGWHSCAIDAGKNIHCWGVGYALQIGSGLGMSPTPVAVTSETQ